jgi:glucosylceramidase
MFTNLSRFIFAIAAIAGSLNAAVSINGTVKDQATGTGIQGAIVSLAGTGLTAITDNAGKYSFGAVAVRQKPAIVPSAPGAALSGNKLSFTIIGQATSVRLDLYSLDGKLVRTELDKMLAPGSYQVNAISAGLSQQLYVLKAMIGATVSMRTVSPSRTAGRSSLRSVKIEKPAEQPAALKTAAVVDTIIAWAVGYDAGKLSIESLTGTYDISLTKSIAAGKVLPLQTTQAGDKLALQPVQTFAADDGSALPTVTVTPTTTYQSIYGFGAAFTECAVYNLCKVTPARKAEVLNMFFNPYTGIGLSLMRTPINSCDFSIAQYDFDPTPNDTGLVNFNMSHDMKWMIPTIKQAMAVPGSNFKLFASPWAPPAWMKTSNTRLGADGGGGGSLRTDCYNAWANYYVKYANTLKANGIPLWGITIQNEPAYDAFWEACVYSAAQELSFLKTALGPTIMKNLPDLKIMIWDHNKDVIVSRVTPILTDATAKNYTWGIAYHRYSGDGWDNMNTVHNQFPTYPMICTEGGSKETFTDAETLAHEIIGDANHWSNGYLVWNLVTDYSGGPYHNRPEPGGVVGPIALDSATNGMKISPVYYYLAHFSRYVQPGAVRVMNAITGTTTLEITAFKNPDGAIVVTVLNKSANAVQFKIKQGTQAIKPTIPAHALMDFIYF